MKKNANLKENVYNAILEDIFSSVYLPGDILNEKNLIEKYNCSKSPVRDALQTLCAENVLRSIPRYGYEVIRLSMEDVQEMLQFRYILEGGMLRGNYKKLTQAQLTCLEEINEKCVEKTSEVWQHWAYNVAFHTKLISFCGNSYAVEELSRCMDRLKRGYAQLCHEKWNREPVIDTRNHELLLTYLRKQEIDKVLECLRDDLNDFADAGIHILP